MPVTAKLSSRFYEKLGDDVTNELVTWLNAVDAEFRNELREANDRNWNQLRAELDVQSSRLTGEFRGGLAELRTELRTEFQAGFANLRVEIHHKSAEQLRYMFGFWVTTVLIIAGLKLL